MRTENIIYSALAPGTPETFTGTLGTYQVNTTSHNLTGSGATMRIWRNGLAPTASADVTLTQASGITPTTNGHIVINLVALNSALNIVSTSESVWHYSLEITHNGTLVHVCSGYLIRTLT